MERRSPDILKSPVNLSQIMHKGGVHSSRIKCKGVQITQINWQELANFLKNVEEHPSREPKYWMLTYIFQYVCTVVDAPLHFSGNGRAFTS